MLVLKKEAIKSLNEKLSLPATGIEQDWEVELADPSRVKVFLSYYQNHLLTFDEKLALMSLILASYNDFLSDNDVKKDGIWYEIKTILESEYKIFAKLINYWGLPNEENPEDWFPITSLIRTVVSQ